MVMALADALHSLLRLPGATYSCVVERDSGRVLAEVGSGESASGDSEGVVPYSVPRWGTAVAAMFDSTSGDELDDVMITGRRSYHLVRPIGPGASVLVYLRLDRSRSNLAAARRELATVRLAGGAVPATTPAARRGPGRASVPPRPTAVGCAAPAARSRSGHGARRAVPSRRRDASRAAGARARGPRTSLDTRPRGASDRSVDAVGRDRSGLFTVVHRYGRIPRGGDADCPLDRLRSSGSRSSGSRSSGSPSSGDMPAGRARPGTTRQIPLPRRASTRSASDAGPVRQRSEAGPVGAVDAPGEPAPEGFAMPAVLGQSWARDPGTLRRLIAGLRRMT